MNWNGYCCYCCYCGAFGHRADNCRWNRGVRLVRPL